MLDANTHAAEVYAEELAEEDAHTFAMDRVVDKLMRNSLYYEDVEAPEWPCVVEVFFRHKDDPEGFYNSVRNILIDNAYEALENLSLEELLAKESSLY